jgi:predicted transcriptional regulator
MAPETPGQIALGELDPQGETVDTLAARMPDFPRAAVEEALSMLSAAGVLRHETGPDGALRYFYADPSRYKLTDMDVIRQPDGATRRGRGRV